MIAMPSFQKLEAKKVREFLQNHRNAEEFKWPDQRTTHPVNDWTELNLASKCFPTLFANGRGDPMDDIRDRKTNFRQHIKHLIKFAYKKRDGSWYYPFSAHPRFAFWALNMIHRHRALDIAGFYLTQHPNEKDYTIPELQLMFLNNEVIPDIVRRLQSYGRTVTGSPPYWFKNCKNLEALLEQQGAATLFMSFSYADDYWPDLHRLLGTENKSFSARRKAINENPHIVMSYFVYRLRDWKHFFLKQCLDEKWSWFRYENQGRGTIHVHMMTKLNHDPDLVKLCKKAWKAKKARLKLEKNNNTLNREQLVRLHQIIKEGDEAKIKVIRYVDSIITTTNPLNAERRAMFKAGKGVQHVCAKRIDGILDEETKMDDDYAEVINSVQRHRRHTNYCLKVKNNKQYCRFGYPMKLERKTDFEFKERRNEGYTVELTTKRNDPELNKHARVQAQHFRSNVDMQIVLDWRACVGYIAKYTSKIEKRGETINQLLSKVLSKLSQLDTATKAIRSMMIATLSIKEYSHQEAMQLILAQQYPLVECEQFQFITADISRNRKIDQNKKVVPSILDVYANRRHYKYEGDILINLHDFITGYKYDEKANKIVLRQSTQDIIINYKPNYKPGNDRNGNKYWKYIKQQLIKYRPWQHSVEMAWNGQEDNEEILEIYQQFIRSPWAKSNLPSYVLDEVDLKVELEDDELLDLEPVLEPASSCRQEAWQILSSLIQRDPNINVNSDYDWHSDAEKYKDIMPRVADHIREINDEPVTYDFDTIQFNPFGLSEGQKMAYDMIKNHRGKKK